MPKKKPRGYYRKFNGIRFKYNHTLDTKKEVNEFKEGYIKMQGKGRLGLMRAVKRRNGKYDIYVAVKKKKGKK